MRLIMMPLQGLSSNLRAILMMYFLKRINDMIWILSLNHCTIKMTSRSSVQHEHLSLNQKSNCYHTIKWSESFWRICSVELKTKMRLILFLLNDSLSKTLKSVYNGELDCDLNELFIPKNSNGWVCGPAQNVNDGTAYCTIDRVKAIFHQKTFFQLKCYSGEVLSPESEYRSQIGQFES